eukprot:1036763-Pelagomonas_calceolata.AAC.5
MADPLYPCLFMCDVRLCCSWTSWSTRPSQMWWYAASCLRRCGTRTTQPTSGSGPYAHRMQSASMCLPTSTTASECVHAPNFEPVHHPLAMVMSAIDAGLLATGSLKTGFTFWQLASILIALLWDSQLKLVTEHVIDVHLFISLRNSVPRAYWKG